MKDDQLILEWFSLRSAVEIGAQYGVPARKVISAWRRLKAAGVLPHGDRPRRNDTKFHNPVDGGQDGRPSVGLDDPLLNALEQGKR